MDKSVKYTSQMYEYLAWVLFREVYRTVEWVEKEAIEIDKLMVSAKKELTEEQIKIVENRARRIENDYKEWAFDDLGEMYGDDDYDDEFDEFNRPHIDFNEEFYDIWKQGVVKRLTVKMTYDSTTSGLLERLVDPYVSSAPYVEGYCHKAKEVRKFRMDRVIDIALTDKKFEKPKNWRIITVKNLFTGDELK